METFFNRLKESSTTKRFIIHVMGYMVEMPKVVVDETLSEQRSQKTETSDAYIAGKLFLKRFCRIHVANIRHYLSH